MSSREAREAILHLSSDSVEFSYERTKEYVSRVKHFMALYRSFCWRHKIASGKNFDGAMCFVGLIPTWISDSVNEIAMDREWTPMCSVPCVCYLGALNYDEPRTDVMEEIVCVYGVFFEFLKSGGDCYPHHGDICIRDACTILR